MKLQTLNNKPISPEDIEEKINRSFEQGEEMPSTSLVVRASTDQGLHNLPIGLQGWQNGQEKTYDLAAATILDSVFYATGSIHDPADAALSTQYPLRDFYGGVDPKEVAALQHTRNNLKNINSKEVKELLEEHTTSFLSDYITIKSAIGRTGKGKIRDHISTLHLRTKGQLLDIRDNLAEFRDSNGPLANKIYSAFDELVESKNFKEDFRKNPIYQPLMTELAQLNSMYKQ